jgi:GH18 family chitinase
LQYHEHSIFLTIACLLSALDDYSYDFTSGSWGDNFTGHHSNLGNNSADPLTRRRQWSGATAIDAVVSLGATPSKVNLGVAFYGRGFKVDTTAMNKQATLPGLYAPSTGASNIETYTEKNVFDFKSLMTTYYKPQNEYWDPVAKSHYVSFFLLCFGLDFGQTASKG